MIQFICIALFSFSAIFCFGQSQSSMNEDAVNNYKKADKELNTVYQQILKDYSTDTVFIKNLKKAEKLWAQFRDAEMNTKYPDRGEGYYGSVQPMCWYMYLTYLTEERIKTLNIWVTGIEEGDACAGSVKNKE